MFYIVSYVAQKLLDNFKLLCYNEYTRKTKYENKANRHLKIKQFKFQKKEETAMIRYELGHALFLKHNDDYPSLMNKYGDADLARNYITQFEIEALCERWGI